MGHCLNCGKESSNPKFCSKSCAAIFNNKNRSPESREAQRRSILKTFNKPYKEKSKKDPVMSAIKTNIKFTLVSQCTYCKKYFDYSKRKSTTCSDKCFLDVKLKINAKGTRIKYKDYILDSLWELRIAQYLDELNFKWSRPTDALEWRDKRNHKRKYFPDFYLPEYNLYLDPKNPIVMIKQKEKVDYFLSNFDNIIIGNVEYILARLKGLEPPCFH